MSPKMFVDSLKALACWLAVVATLSVGTSSLNGAPGTSQKAPQSPQSEEAGSKFVVADLRIDGDIENIDAVQTRILKSLGGREYQSHRRSLDDIRGKIEADFQDRGYFKVVLSNLHAQPVDSQKDRLRIIVHVDEGQQYRAGDISFVSDEKTRPLVVPEAELRQQFHVQTGDPFSARQLRRGVAGIRELYLAHGYLDISMAPEFSIDKNNSSIASTWDVRQGKQYHVGSFDVRGLDTETKALLRAEMRPGSLFDQTLVKQLYEQGKASPDANVAFDSFDDVVSLTPHAEAGTVDILFDFSASALSAN